MTWLILVGILVFFGLICLGVLFARKKLHLSDKKNTSDEHQIAEENVSRYLEDVTDPETQKEFEKYSNEENKD